MSFKRYSSIFSEDIWDDNLRIHDFTKMESMELVHHCFLAKERLEEKESKRLRDCEFSLLKKYIQKEEFKN